MTSDDDYAPPQQRLAMPELMIGLGLLACAAVTLWQTLAIPVSPMYSKVGPTVFPYMTTAGLAVLALLLIIAAARGGWQPEEEKETPTDWKAMGFVVAGLVLVRKISADLEGLALAFDRRDQPVLAEAMATFETEGPALGGGTVKRVVIDVVPVG